MAHHTSTVDAGTTNVSLDLALLQEKVKITSTGTNGKDKFFANYSYFKQELNLTFKTIALGRTINLGCIKVN